MAIEKTTDNKIKFDREIIEKTIVSEEKTVEEIEILLLKAHRKVDELEALIEKNRSDITLYEEVLAYAKN